MYNKESYNSYTLFYTKKKRRSMGSLLTKLPAVYISSIIKIKRS